jgi:hypothetical protein
MLSIKLFNTNIDENLKNHIISNIFKYLYINQITKNQLLPLKLCYLINQSDIDYAINILNNNNNDLILVKRKYISNIDIYIYKKNNKIFIINIKSSTNDIFNIHQVI